jgi:ABC-type sugar transport system permease subunit
MVGVSFTDLSYALPGHDGNFLGFDNYRRLMREDPVFWESFSTTLTFVFGVVSVEFVLGFALALLLFHHIQRRRVVLTLLLIPMMLAPVAVGLMWKLMLQGEFGMLTHYLREIGLLGLRSAPLGNYDLVLPTVMLVDVWEWTPFVTLVVLAGLLSLPREPFEAAVMDGARPSDRRWPRYGDRAAQHLHLADQLPELGPGLRRGQRLHGLFRRTHPLRRVLQGDLLGRGEGAQVRRTWRIVAIGALVVVLVVVLTPYLWLLMTSFKTRLDALADAPVWWFTPTLEH